MKIFKLLPIIAFLFFNCSEIEDVFVPENENEILSASIIFDSQDNVISINNANYISNLNEKFKFSILHLENEIEIVSEIYKIEIVEPLEFRSDFEILYSENKVSIFYEALFEHLNYSDFFEFDIYFKIKDVKN